MVRCQDSEHFAAIIDTCVPQLLMCSWKERAGARPQFTIQQPGLFTLLLFFLGPLGSELCSCLSSFSPFFYLCQFTQVVPPAPLDPLCHQDQCFQMFISWEAGSVSESMGLGGAQDSAFLASSPVMLILLLLKPQVLLHGSQASLAGKESLFPYPVSSWPVWRA